VTSYDICCIDCGCNAGFETLPSGYESRHYNVPAMQSLIAISKQLSPLTDEVFKAIDELFSSGIAARLQWFRDHANHELAVFDEYGRREEGCKRETNCNSCGSTMAHCNLPANHDGPCRNPKKG